MSEVLPLNTMPLPLKLRMADYLQLDASGAFTEYGKTELIDGEIYFINAQHRPHARIKSQLYLEIASRLREMRSPVKALVEASIAMPDHSAPEPDIVLTSEPDGDGLIPLTSVALVIEVADTSLAQDLGRKASLYAREQVPEYWVVDVNARTIHQMWEPIDSGYGERHEVPFGSTLTAATIPDLTIATSELQ